MRVNFASNIQTNCDQLRAAKDSFSGSKFPGLSKKFGTRDKSPLLAH